MQFLLDQSVLQLPLEQINSHIVCNQNAVPARPVSSLTLARTN
jgi:hypothetical protein